MRGGHHLVTRENKKCTELMEWKETVTKIIFILKLWTETKGEIFTTFSTAYSTEVKLKINTGAKCNFMSLSTLQNIDSKAEIDQSNKVNVTVYEDQTIQTMGTSTF